jgi:predicted nucleic acid-binding protein
MKPFQPPVVLDATVLSNLAYTDDLDLLDRLTASCVTVEAVNEELRAGTSSYDELARAVDAIEMIDYHEPTNTIRTALDRGEAHALQAAIDHDGTLATDDLPAREHAADRNVPLTGSVGLLVRLVVQNDLTADDADEILHQWITEYRYRSPVESVHEVLDNN